jgi:cell division protein FtsX
MVKPSAKQTKRKTLLSLLIRGFLIVALIDLIVIAIVAGIGWWTGWTEQGDFQNAIQVAGLLVIGLGLLGIKGNLDSSRSFEYQYSMSVSKDSSWERTQQTLFDLAQSYAFMLIMFIAGVVCLLIGWLM